MNTNQKRTKEIFFGKDPAEIALDTIPDKISEIFFVDSLLDKGLKKKIYACPSINKIKLTKLTKEELERLVRGNFEHKDTSAPTVHQNIAFTLYKSIESELKDQIDLIAEKDSSLILLLDQCTDPHNLGSITRAAEVFGADLIIKTERGSSPINSTVIKASSGAALITPIVNVTNLNQTIEKIKKLGYWVYGTSLTEGAKDIREFAFPKKTALVMGSEGFGIRKLTESSCDDLLYIPMQGKVGSLNIGQATAVALYEVRRSLKI